MSQSHKAARLGANGLRLSALKLGVCAGALLLGVATAAQAQDAQETVVVTGFRGSLQEALSIKRESIGAVDTILAEDIAKFPDLNLSESLQRVPGVSITRDAGEGRQIAVRGLGAQFTRVRINGIEALATTGGTDAAGGTNRDRAFDFNIFASELFNAVTVRKTASAEVEEGSLGATVDLRTPRPFDFDGFKFSVSGKEGYNDLAETYNPRGAALISDTFANGQLGMLVSVAYAKHKIQDEGSSTVRWQNDGSNPPGFGTPAGSSATNRFGTVLGVSCAAQAVGSPCADVNAAFHPRIPRYDAYVDDNDRLGITGSFQFQPSDRTLISVDLLYGKFSGTRNEIFLEAPSFSTSGNPGLNNTDVAAYEIDSNNTLVYGVFNDVDTRVESRYDELTTTFRQATIEGTQQFGEDFKLHALAGWSESKHRNPIQTTILFDANDFDNYVYDFRQDNRLPLITYGNLDVTSPTQFTLSQIRMRPQTADNKYSFVSGDAEYKWADWLSLKGGVEARTYKFSSTELRRSSENAPTLASAGLTQLSQISSLLTGFGKGLDIPAGTPKSWVIPDLNATSTAFNIYCNCLVSGAAGGTGDFTLTGVTNANARGNIRRVEEDTTGFYVQADFSTAVWNMPFRGNLGVRYVKTDQSSTGYQTIAGAPVEVTVDRDYDDTLPSLNLVLEPMDDLLIRFGAAKVVARSGLGNLTPGGSVSVSGSNLTVTQGNPALDPFRADAYDLGAEWYFDEGALFSVALFHKKIDSFVQTTRNAQTLVAGFGAQAAALAQSACGLNYGPSCNENLQWQYTQPLNTPGGNLDGIEINYQQPFKFLPAPFDNMGALANFTYVQSKVTYLINSNPGSPTVDGDITNLSRRAYNLTLYYEDDVFMARASAAYRSSYPTTVPGRNGHTLEATAATFNVDASLSYKWDDRITITLEGLNLTDEFNDQYLDPGDRLSFYHHTGREFFLGIQYAQ